jgi:ATP-dependent Zn protease
MAMTAKQRKTTAYHEAGHAVTGRVLTPPCGYATIRPNYAKAVAGHVTEPHACLTEWERRGKVRDNGNAVWYARIITYMAGAEAEKELLGSTVIGDGDDRDQIALMAEELPGGADWGKLEPRLRAMARMLVRRHQKRIELVARALLAKTTLSAKALDKLVGRSVDDVKVNAPFLLAMHR